MIHGVFVSQSEIKSMGQTLNALRPSSQNLITKREFFFKCLCFPQESAQRNTIQQIYPQLGNINQNVITD